MKIKDKGWLEILFWIVIIVLFIMILTRIFGKSATDVQIYITILTGMLAIMTYLIKSNNQISKMNREIGEMKTQITESFKKVREDINKLQNKKRR